MSTSKLYCIQSPRVARLVNNKTKANTKTDENKAELFFFTGAGTATASSVFSPVASSGTGSSEALALLRSAGAVSSAERVLRGGLATTPPFSLPISTVSVAVELVVVVVTAVRALASPTSEAGSTAGEMGVSFALTGSGESFVFFLGSFSAAVSLFRFRPVFGAMAMNDTVWRNRD